MGGKESKFLERARNSPFGWKRGELDKLYAYFGFIIRAGAKHDIVVHPDHRELRATLTRSSKDLPPGYIRHAVDMIDKLMQFKKDKRN